MCVCLCVYVCVCVTSKHLSDYVSFPLHTSGRSGEALAANAAKRLHVAEEQIEEEEDILSQYAMAATEAMPTMSSTSSGVLDGKGVAISCQFSKKNRAFAVESVRSNGGRVVGSCEADYILMPLERAESEDKGGVSLSGRGMPVTMAWLVSCVF